MLIQLNGENREVLEAAVLSDLIYELSLAPARIAIEVNQRVVRRDQWERTALVEGDRIEIVHFVGGGTFDGRLGITHKMCVPRSS